MTPPRVDTVAERYEAQSPSSRSLVERVTVLETSQVWIGRSLDDLASDFKRMSRWVTGAALSAAAAAILELLRWLHG